MMVHSYIHVAITESSDILKVNIVNHQSFSTNWLQIGIFSCKIALDELDRFEFHTRSIQSTIQILSFLSCNAINWVTQCWLIRKVIYNCFTLLMLHFYMSMQFAPTFLYLSAASISGHNCKAKYHVHFRVI